MIFHPLDAAFFRACLRDLKQRHGFERYYKELRVKALHDLP